MIGTVAKIALRVALAPAELAAKVALDVLFGKEEEFEYPHSTVPDVFADYRYEQMVRVRVFCVDSYGVAEVCE